MGTFKDSLKKWFYTQGSAVATSSSRLPLLDASGNPIGSDTPNNLFKKQPLFTANVGVATYESDALYFHQPNQAQAKASVSVGVWVQECGKLIIVGESQLTSELWSASVAGGGTPYKGREAAIADMNGRTNTDTIYNTLGSNARAVSYCKGYCPSNVNTANAFVGSGRWWLPSGGEMWMIWSHLLEINRVLEQIGGTPINTSLWYWTSTERSASYAWCLGNGYFDEETLKTESQAVIPITGFY